MKIEKIIGKLTARQKNLIHALEQDIMSMKEGQALSVKGFVFLKQNTEKQEIHGLVGRSIVWNNIQGGYQVKNGKECIVHMA
ncbi:MAG: hypothetical protein PHU71_06775 [Candidatus Gracilibacteria bacterium]|nr:hypothetical protein [Candidatus Gracilibacteria bacterium]